MENMPYVNAALICERVLQEQDGTLTAVRIVDRAEIQITDVPNVPDASKTPNVIPAIQLTGLIALKSGPAKGKGVLTIAGRRPSGESKELGKFEVDLQGEDHGQNFIINLTMVIQEEGLHWFDVFFDGQPLTSIPLRILRTVKPIGMTARTSESPKRA